MKPLITLAAVLLSVAAIAFGQQDPDVSGSWDLKVDSAQRSHGVGMSLSGTLSLSQEGTALSGAWTGPSGDPRDVSGSIEANAVTLEMKAAGPRGREITVTFEGTVASDDSDEMSGTVKGPGVDGQSWTASRSE